MTERIHRVLVIGFERHMVLLAERIFERQGATVRSADDLSHAIDALKKELPDLIVVDPAYVPGDVASIAEVLLEAVPEAASCQLLLIPSRGRDGSGSGGMPPFDPTAFANVANSGRELAALRAR